jgi:hypothetical protein
MNFQWMIKSIWTITQVSDEVKKQTIVVEEMNQQYPQSVAIDFLNDKVSLLEALNVWDVVNVGINLRAKEVNWEWWARQFNSVNWWKVDVVAKTAA